MSLALLTALLVALAPGAAQDSKPAQPDDDPPVLLKKKKADDKPSPAKPEPNEEKPKAEAKPDAKKDDPDADLEAKSKEIMARIAKNLRSAEDRLKSNDTGDGTQQVQRDIVKDLDSLLETIKQQEQQQQNQQQQPGVGMGGGKSKPGGTSRRTVRKPGQGQKQGQGQGQGQGQQPSAKGGEKPGQGPQEKGQGQGGDQAGKGGTSPEGVDKLADLYKDVWGHLPETLRQEMDAYQKEGYMAKYRELLKLYYATIAEKGRRATEDGK